MLIIVRHGRTPANAQGLLLGRLDPDLDDIGEAQAAAVAAWIGPIDRLVSSPLLRCRRTAEAFGMDVEIDERWIELDYGELDGRRFDEVSAEVWTQLRTDPEFAPRGGESMAALARRVGTACDELLADGADADIVVVTHVSPIKAALSWALGGTNQVGWRTRVGQPSITRIASGPHGPVLHAFNEAPR
ncbi:MAG: histidine phosphatase family protein [Acidimicrobiia bacterium]|nr:histidine phosphatase family protein [Acidimicrobiia bacterium]